MNNYPMLIAGLHRDDESSFVQIHRIYYKRLLLFAKKYVKSFEIAEEVVSDTFLKVWEKRHAIKTEESLEAFLFICTKNACLNILRKPSLQEPLDSILNTDFDISKDVDAYTKILQTELILVIHKELLNLSERQREIFVMSFIEGFSVEEISHKLNVSPDVIYANKSRSLAILRKRFTLLGYEQYFASIVLLFSLN